MRGSVSRISIPKTKTFSKKASEVNPMKRFGRYMLKIATFTTVLTFVGLLFLNAGWVSPKPMGETFRHIYTIHEYKDIHTYHGVIHIDRSIYENDNY